MLVSVVLALLTASKEGLCGVELEDIVSCQDDVLDDVYEWWTPPVRRLSPMLISRILYELKSYLVERGTKDGSKVLYWYHRQFWQTSTARYLSDDTFRKTVCVSITGYFGVKIPKLPI